MRLINHSLGDGLIVLSQTSHHPSNFFFINGSTMSASSLVMSEMLRGSSCFSRT